MVDHPSSDAAADVIPKSLPTSPVATFSSSSVTPTFFRENLESGPSNMFHNPCDGRPKPLFLASRIANVEALVRRGSVPRQRPTSYLRKEMQSKVRRNMTDVSPASHGNCTIDNRFIERYTSSTAIRGNYEIRQGNRDNRDLIQPATPCLSDRSVRALCSCGTAAGILQRFSTSCNN